MIILSSIASDKTDKLIDYYSGLLNHGVSTSEILVLVQNSTLKNHFIKQTLSKLEVNAIEKLQVHSFFSLVYNTVSDNWAFLEDRNIYDNPAILPNLVGLEVSQFLFKDVLKTVPFKGYNSRLSLLHQLFRRYSLIVQNNLSQIEVDEKAKILKEGFSDDANLAIKRFLRKTLELRDFDYLRQCLLFNFVYKNTSYFHKIKYLIVDDLDECTPICMDFIEYLLPKMTDFCITIDKYGSSRCGYLSANKNNYQKVSKYTTEIVNLEDKSKLSSCANKLYKNIVNSESNILSYFSYESYSKRAKIVDCAIKKIDELIKKRVNVNEIAIITPVIDDMLKFSLNENLNKSVNPVYLSGSEKLIQNKLVKATITLFKLNTYLKNSVTEFDIRVLLYDILQIPLKYCFEILQEFDKEKIFIDYEFNDENYNNRYKTLQKVVLELENTDIALSEQIIYIYKNLFNMTNITTQQINKFNFFIKQMIDFENVFGKNFSEKKADIILQIENSIISENPYSILEFQKNDLIISTPQKIIDNQIKTKYQIWLDISNSNWVKSDTGPLYNAWVFQKDWAKPDYTIEDNISLTKEKIARVLRKLTLCTMEHVFCYSSLFDTNGIENYGGIEQYINVDTENEAEEEEVKEFKIVPRLDQKPVLDYKNGFMGISAVPGAGKTTILLALIIKLLDSGVNPENIFVLTYMDSAARNFRERIKNVRKNSSKLPNISTIHGLALRILKENGNYEKLGLSGDFEICDDANRDRILKEIASSLKIEQKVTEEFNRGVSIFKINGGSFANNNKKSPQMSKFELFFEEYQNRLKESNLIDYDDMLRGAVKLLQENKDILNYYQNICEYIIEDEAQDSSGIQQQLISLLSGKHKNVIRCGDVNQSITATFSNADTKGFKDFITTNNNVSMNCSQRCTKNVWEFANDLVDYSLNQKDSKNAFFKMFMHPVEGKNPQPLSKRNSVEGIIFENAIEEKNYILKIIKSVLNKYPNFTVGILLRDNYQVARWQTIIEDNGLKAITRNHCLEQKAVFKGIFAIMKIVLNPFDNNNLYINYEILADLGFFKRGLGNEIIKYENPFIQVPMDNINNLDLERFAWNINWWTSLCVLPPWELAVKVGLSLFKNEIEKSNIYLISTLIKQICMKNTTLEYTVNKLQDLSKKANLSGFKFFTEEDEDDKKLLEGKIQIMTMHKSKGDEFNLVFIPELTDFKLSLSIPSINLKSSDFIEEIKKLNPNYKIKSEYELKQEILDENLRLLYVAITRAKNKLYLTTSKVAKNKYNKEQKQKCCKVFQDFFCEEGISG